MMPIASALVVELTKVVWHVDPDSFDDVAAQCRWYTDCLSNSEQGLATAHVVRLFAASAESAFLRGCLCAEPTPPHFLHPQRSLPSEVEAVPGASSGNGG